MLQSRLAILSLTALVLLPWGVVSAQEAERKLPEPADRKVDFHKEVGPILVNSCAKCHAGGQKKGGFAIDTREDFLRGGDAGEAVIVGNSAESYLIDLVVEPDKDIRMPKQGPALTDVQVGILRAWIDQGLEWEEGYTFKRTETAPLQPRRVELPEVAGDVTNPIDRLLATYLGEHQVNPDWSVDDKTFARRAYLDTIGLLPPPDDLDAFVRDQSHDKRKQLVRELLRDRHNYALHWLSFWNDALRNDYAGTGYIDGGRKQITPWLYTALAENKPYDQFVRELVSPSSESEGFVKGIVWRGVVNASQVPEMQAAQNISQVFLGINLKCASCHDSFINDWKLDDAYGLAAIFAPGQLEKHHCDKPIGEMAEIKFLFPELGSIDAAAPREQRMEQLAQVLTSADNGRLSRTIVNRLWAQFFGRGLVEPVDEMDEAPWNRDLLDWLAVDLAENKYDLKHTIELILTSKAYSMPAVEVDPNADPDDYVFRGPVVRRMSAEQFVDALGQLTADWPAAAAVALPAVDGEAAIEPAQLGVRSSLVVADPLTVALGRPNREQVVTDRPDVATTLQALELTNGSVLAAKLKKGAQYWSGTGAVSAEDLVTKIYRQALGREPLGEERSVALEMISSSTDAAGIEDLLWVLVMYPEFQLIY